MPLLGQETTSGTNGVTNGVNGTMSHNEEHVDIAVIGGGPTGLLTALLASQLGATVSVIDIKNGPLQLGRADALNARTQQVLEVVGIIDELTPRGITCNTSTTFGNGEFITRQSHWWNSLSHCFRKNFLMVGQPVVEEVLQKRLETPVHYNESAVSISETDSGVTVTTDKGRTVYSKYAVAADGARSMVRNALDIGFTGTKPEMVWAVLDTFIDTDFPLCNEIVTFQMGGQSRVSWIPRERGMARFYILLEGEITQQKAEDSIREHMAPHRVDFVRTEWFSTFDVKERIASTFISDKGRILLAGDAAHVHSVNGGQGLNTGISDAFALAWRVATAVTNKSLAPGAAAKLLKSYDTERRTVCQDVINVAALLVRDTLHTAKQYVGTIEKNAGYITGMGVAYDDIGSELIADSEQRSIWKAGKRCPDIYLTKSGDKEAQRLYSMVPYGKYLVFMIGGQQGCQCCFKDVATHFTVLPTNGNRTWTEGMSSRVAPPPAAESGEAVYTSDMVSKNDKFVVVVRPDMYIGYVGEQAGWKEYLTNLFAH